MCRCWKHDWFAFLTQRWENTTLQDRRWRYTTAPAPSNATIWTRNRWMNGKRCRPSSSYLGGHRQMNVFDILVKNSTNCPPQNPTQYCTPSIAHLIIYACCSSVCADELLGRGAGITRFILYWWDRWGNQQFPLRSIWNEKSLSLWAMQ